jgi:AAA15 family ATPase/GTPase
MIVNITFKNHRSIKNEQSFSLEATASKLKMGNTFSYSSEGSSSRLLKSTVIYGSNASGKSNLIRLMFSMQKFIINSTELKTGDPISDKYYDPFLLDRISKNEPTEFSIDFIAFNKKQHRYIIKFNSSEVLYEYLGVYDSARITKIFERTDSSEIVDLGDAMENGRENREVPKNNAYLSKFGNSINEQMKDIYLYFKSLEIWNAVADHHTGQLYNKIQSMFNNHDKEELRRKISKLINIADTKIAKVEVAEKAESDFAALPENIRGNMFNKYRYETFGVHNIFENGSVVGEERFSFLKQESQGTKIMFAIGGLILEAFERSYPTIIFLDEFDNSLHPDLAKFLIELFHNPKVNKNNSQLIFATHETTLLDNKIFRKDQIWFGEKNKYGETDFFSVKDFKNINTVRSDIPFDKWYRSGKFGAVPNIRKFEFIAEYEER